MDKNKVIEGAAKLVAKGAYDKAIKEYQKVLEADPRDVRVLQKMGELYQKKNDNAQAAVYFTKVAESYAADGFFLKAVALYKQVQKLDANLFEVNVKLGELHQQLGLMSEATAYFQLVANHYDKQGNVRASLDTLKKMVDLDPDNTSSRRKLAELYTREGMNVEAAVEFKRVADYFLKNNRQDDYLAVAERIAHLEPENIGLSRELARTYLQKGDQKRALAKLQVCFKADSRDVITLELLAEAFNGLGQTSKTMSVYKELAKVYAEKGNAAEADELWEKIARLDPADADVHQRRAPVAPTRAPEPRVTSAAPTASRPASAPVQPAAAPPSSAGAEPLRKDQLAKLLTETDVYMKYGLHDKALEHLRRVFAVEPENLDAHEKAYHIYVGAKQSAQASEQLLNVLRLCTRRQALERAQPYLDTLMKENAHHPEMPAFLSVLRPGGAEESLNPVVTDEEEDEAILMVTPDDDIVVSDAPEDALAEQAGLVTDGFSDDDGVVIETEDEAENGIGVELSDVVEHVVDEPFNPESTVQVDAAYAREAYGKTVPDDDDVIVEDAELDSSITDPEGGADDGLEATRADVHALGYAAEDSGEAELEVISTELPEESFGSDDLSMDDGFSVDAAEDEVAQDFGPRDATSPTELAFEHSTQPNIDVDDFTNPSGLSASGSFDSEPGGEAFDEVVSDDDFVSAEEEPVEAPPEEDPDDPVAAECEEAAFFLDQGLLEEAREILETVMIARPGHARGQELLDQLDTLERNGAGSGSGDANHVPTSGDAPPPVAAVDSGEGRDAFDLAAELAGELDDLSDGAPASASSGNDDFQYSVEEVFSEFKKGLAKVVKPEDVDTHYDLGIAYKEMGLMDDAIGEFQVAREGCLGKKKEVDCLTMSAMLQGMKGDWAGAVQSLKLALGTEHAFGEMQKALTYELGQAQDSAGESGKALFHFQKVAEMDATYRDVAERVSRLEGQVSPEEDLLSGPARGVAKGAPRTGAAAARKVGYL